MIHVWYIVEEGAPGLKLSAELYRGVKDTGVLVRASWGAAPAEGLEWQDGDFVVETIRMNARHGTRLHTLLAGLGRYTIIVTGAWTNMSVEHTARTGADYGSFMVVPEDGCSTMNADWHNASINYALQNISTVTTCGAVTKRSPACPQASEDEGRGDRCVRQVVTRHLMSVEHVERLRVAWIDTDAGGRIHFTNAFRWAELAETGLLRSLALLDGWSDYPRKQVEAEFVNVLRFEDEIEVAIRVERVGRTSITYAWTIAKDGVAHITGRHTVVNVDSEGRPEPLADHVRAALSA